jgi:lactate dehydrogenase-like 2-hydroxyacid dehydrogenase
MRVNLRGLSLFVACALPDAVNRDLAEHFSTTFAPGLDPLAALAASVSCDDALLVDVGVRLDAKAIKRLPAGIRAIATYSVGLDHIDLAAAAQCGTAVFNTPEVLDDAVAEAAILLLLGAARRATESIALIRSGQWAGWTAKQLNGVQLTGKTLGIFGMGRIGRRIAALARAFGMTVAYSNRRPVEPAAAADARYYETLRDMVAAVDCLLLAAPSSADTRGIVNARLLAAAKPGVILVNIARGDLVNDDELIDALQTGRVGSAGLDVFAGEPKVNPRYFDLPNVFMLPHIGSSTVETRRAMGRVLIAGLQAWWNGDRPPNRVV